LEVKFWLRGNEEKLYIRYFSGHLQNKHYDSLKMKSGEVLQLQFYAYVLKAKWSKVKPPESWFAARIFAHTN
jgi:hypothetical protein